MSLLVLGSIICGCSKKREKEILMPSLFSTIEVYIINGFEPEKIDLNTLNNTSYVYFDKKLTKDIFGDVTYHSSNKVVWKGCYFGVAKFKNGEEKKLRISINGAFYDIVGHKGHYQTTGKSREIFVKKLEEAILESSDSKRGRKGRGKPGDGGNLRGRETGTDGKRTGNGDGTNPVRHCVCS